MMPALLKHSCSDLTSVLRTCAVQVYSQSSAQPWIHQMTKRAPVKTTIGDLNVKRCSHFHLPTEAIRTQGPSKKGTQSRPGPASINEFYKPSMSSAKI
uniref:Uncharacterized protein n=1 Tax=Heliothis virescens TaxID=7102 RepID=A0A2A4JB95_HELVI